ncbi:MAG: permease, partial [Halobacteria archaeon]|nr:permease [Halobacteria archaeon]
VPTIDDAYRRYYGLRMAVVLFVTIFATAVVAGVIIHYAWGAIGLIPAEGKAGGTAPKGYTTILNAVFTVVFLAQVYVTFFETEAEETGAHAH